MIQSLTRTVAVSVCSVLLTTLAVNATDHISLAEDSMLAGVFGTSERKSQGPCPSDMVLVTQALEPFCVDRYEAAAGEACTYAQPKNAEETVLNLATSRCNAVSAAGAEPWRFVDQHQAASACSRSGKRLLTVNEWYKAALGTPDRTSGFTEEHCNVARNVADGPAQAGSAERCVSDSGAYDMVGNVWEWVDSVVKQGELEGQTLPRSGYVSGADTSGLVYETQSSKQEAFASDRVWVDASITAGIMRGGYFDSASDAGIYSVYAASPPSFTGDAVGFRCALTVVGNE